jgi:hypothetical protein
MKADAIPFLIQGKIADPKFVPDMKGMSGSVVNGALGGAKSGAKAPLSAASGLLGKAPH